MAQPTSDRNLLFGILALQNDFVSRDALLEAMNAWVLAKDRSLGDILRERGAITAEEQALLDALIDRQIVRHGDAERSLAALSSASSMKALLAPVADADVQASLAHVSSGIDADATGPYVPLSTDGVRYQILRPHAKGGLGEVFVAEDVELHRQVALKEIQAQYAGDAHSRARFVLEAEITGGLEHPGIVPVYGLGAYADGRPFYAMRFIRGDNLKAAVEQFHGASPVALAPGDFHSVAFRRLLGRLLDVCNAVAYAHSRGVLHRDLKPGNVMLGKFGETLLVDWGLAKVVGRAGDVSPRSADEESTLRPSSGSDVAATQAGVALGTPAYMSPEQAAGRLDQLGPATDIYSLGAMLYALLTGHTPFSGKNKGELLQRVQRGDFPPPRRVQAAVPRALEAACLKAMAHEPEARYGSVQELAAELERWLADEPVAAWREPLTVRLRRWGRRHRPVVAGGAVLLLAAAVLAMVVAVLSDQSRRAIAREQAETERQREDAEAAREDAERRRQEAEVARARTRRALDDMTSQVAADWLATKELLPEQQRFLEMAIEYYREFAAEGGADEADRRRVAEGNFQLARLLQRLGKMKEAETVYRKALDLFEGLTTDYGGHQYRLKLSQIYNNLGLLLADLGNGAEAERAHRKAVEVQEKLTSDFPTSPQYRLELAISHNNLGLLLKDLGKQAQAKQSYQQTLGMLEKLAADFPAVSQYRHLLATCRNNLGVVLKDLGEWAEAEQSYRKALALCEQLTIEVRPHPAHRLELARSHNNMGTLLMLRGKWAEAEQAYRKALELKEKLATDFPAVPLYRQELAGNYDNLGVLLAERGRRGEAEQAHRKALDILQKLVTDFPTMPQYRQGLATCHTNMGALLMELGNRAEAEQFFRKALELLEMLAADFPAVPEYGVSLGRSYGNFGHLVRGGGKPEEALAWYARAIGTLTPILQKQPRLVVARQSLRNVHEGRALVLDQLQRHIEAVKDWDRALALDDAKNPALPSLRALSLARAGEHTKAVTAAEELAKGQGTPAATLYDCACVHALASAAVKDDARLKEQQAVRAVALLKQAQAKGFLKDRAIVEHLKKNADLDALRERADFREWLQQLEQQEKKDETRQP